jgi:hypothetical protein
MGAEDLQGIGELRGEDRRSELSRAGENERAHALDIPRS